MTIYSMTAFARQEYQATWGQLYWEIRSVNHRFLEITLRLPEDLRSLEPSIRELIQKHIKRGKVDCVLYLKPNKLENFQLNVNFELIEQLWSTVQRVNQITHNMSSPSAIDLLNFPNVLEKPSLNADEWKAILLPQLEEAINKLLEARAKEGQQLASLLKQRCQSISQEVIQVRAALPDILQTQRERLQTRIAELVEVESERLEQEIVILMQKMDVSEEIDRLDTHIAEIQHILEQGGTVGRRLDFLIQELHREANTLGAKSNHITTSHSAVELKVLIEQMREQIQNIE